ncbi:MAG TPA: EamA family transporter [Myxococcota bacterium]
MNAALPLSHFLLALAVVAVWGSNFIVMKLALAQLPPLLLATLRFACAFLPGALLLRRPRVPLATLAAYGLAIGVGQFALLYLAMTRFISPGLASLVLQTQVFFTIGIARLALRERLFAHQAAGLALAAGGVALIAAHTDGDATPLGLALALAAALGWASGNVIGKRAQPDDMLAFTLWSSAFAVPPLLALSLAFEGVPAIAASLRAADAGAWAAVLFQGWGNTLFGYGIWNWLLARHPVATIAPLSLLVPIIGMSGSAWLLGESLPGWKLAAAALVLAGLALNALWPRLRALL